MAGHDEKYLESCAAHALGALDDNQVRGFQDHLASPCTICQQELSQLGIIAAMLPLALAPVHVAPELKERILFNARLAQVAKATLGSAGDRHEGDPSAAIDERRSDTDTSLLSTSSPQAPAAGSGPPRRSWLALGLAFAFIVMAVGFSAYITTLFGTIDQQRVSIEEQRSKLADLVNKLEGRSAVLQVFQGRNIDVVSLDGTSANPGAHGTVVWNADRRELLLIASGLAIVEEGKRYQLWLLTADAGRSLATFAITNQRESEYYVHIATIPSIARSQPLEFRVGLEPAGGSTQSAGDPVLIGRLDPR